MKIFVGNLSYTVCETDLRQAFEAFGQVTSATIVRDPDGKGSKGFGFVEMPEPSQAGAAIMSLNGQAIRGRTISASEARPDKDARRDKERGGGDERRGGGRY